ncbi:hypothetical protein D049_1729B, partial [Vibrio parahaemolyticus VPTS-2010]
AIVSSMAFRLASTSA